MWTQSTPYLESQKTEASIERHGGIALSRALNIARVVGFIGSGVSIAYGRPSWIELVELIIGRLDAWRRNGQKPSPEVQSLCDQLDFLLGRAPGAEEDAALDLDKLAAQDLTTILEIVDNLFDTIGSLGDEGLGTLRASVAELLKQDRRAVARARFLRHVGSDAHLPANFDWSSSYAEQNAYFLTATGRSCAPAQSNLDPIHKIYKVLNIRRFLTLNFDVEIERYLARALSITNAESSRSHAQLLSLIGETPAPGAPSPPNRRIAIETGLERALLTVTMSEDNVGELVNFAMYPAAYSSQVFHLHGRIDDPENMVITERDYQRIYMPDDEGRRTFREALENVFAGNDVLFIGVGMKETDIMRPLRQFVSQERLPDSEARRVFALMEQIHESDLGAELVDQIRSDRQKEIQRALRLNIQYGVHTLIYGGSDGRIARIALRAVRSFAECELSAEQARKLLHAALAESDRRRDRWAGSDQGGRLQFHELLTEVEVGELDQLLDIDVRTGPRHPNRKAAISAYARLLENRVRVRALCRELDLLADRSARWWNEWRRSPREREAIFREHHVNPDHPIWVRHKADYAPLEAGDTVPAVIGQLRDLGRDIYATTDRDKRCVLGVGIERGGGKGALTHLLQQPILLPDGRPDTKAFYETIFPEARYSGAFFAHLSFSMEFSSVISALTRFLAGRLAAIHGHPAAFQHRMEKFPGEAVAYFAVDDNGRPTGAPRGTHRLTALHGLLTAFAHSPKRDGRKIFLCFSGVNRLCDNSGLARHPMHRAFFRLLSGQGLVRPGESSEDFPIDLLVLSGNTDHPIRYLSEERALEAFDSEVRRLRDSTEPEMRAQALELINAFDRRQDIGVAIRHWPVLEPIAWNERYWQFQGRDEPTSKAAEDLRNWNPPFGLDSRGNLPGAGDNGRTAAMPALNRLLQQSVAFSAWISAAWRELAAFLQSGHDRRETLYNWLERLDAAAARRQFSSVLDEIFSDYQRMDNAVALCRRAGLHDAVLRHLALFTLPIELGVLYDCPDIHGLLSGGAKYAGDSMAMRRKLAAALDTLCARALVIRVSAKIRGADADDGQNPAPRHVRYVLHPQLRDYFAHKMGLSVPADGDSTDFQMTVYCDQPRDLPTPSANHYRLLRRILDTQIDACRDTLWPFYQIRRAEAGRTAESGDRLVQCAEKRNRERAYRQLGELIAVDERDELEEPGVKLHSIAQRIRACYGLLRGAFSIGSISRLDGIEEEAPPGQVLLDAPFERFRGWLRSLANAAVGLDEVGPYIDAALAGELSLSAFDAIPARPVAGRLEPPVSRIYRPLYREEIAWLYNERGLVSLVQGRLYDAMPLFERAYQIVRHRRDTHREDPAFHAGERRIQLNHAIAHIERGNLADARRMLLAIAREATPGLPSPISTGELAKGYLGLVDHLSGHFEQAQAAYQRIVSQANAGNQLRLTSIFNRHWSDLRRLIGDYGEADRRADFAISTAMQSEQRDVLHLALLSKARIHRDKEKRDDALTIVRQCETYARRLGVPRIEVEAAQVLAEIMLRQGEETLAGATAARAVALAGRYGMRLRKISCLTLYGDILEKRNQMELAARVRSEARIYAERLGYQIKAGRLAEALARQAV